MHTVTVGGVLIRRATASDREAIYDVCFRTGDAGGDASGLYSDRDLFGDVWVGPYLELRPNLAFVAEGDAGLDGYVVGADDTTTFESACEARWWPALRARYPDPPVDGQLTPDQQLHRLVPAAKLDQRLYLVRHEPDRGWLDHALAPDVGNTLVEQSDGCVRSVESKLEMAERSRCHELGRAALGQ